jgi:nucleoside 2-deoxyribosyltransferase
MKVYLAGPAVFRPDAAQALADDARLCAALGLEALTPLDETLTGATAILAGNIRLIEAADAVIADLTPFRGPHCNVGTAWEIGYAYARGKPVFAWSRDPRPLTQRIPNTAGRDAEGWLVEDFGLAENLMIAAALTDRTVHPDLRAAAAASAAHLGTTNMRRDPRLK